MTHLAVAPNAVQRFCSRLHGINLMHEIPMATDAVVLQDLTVLLVNANGFVEILQRKALGMPKAVLRLGQVFGDKVLWQMTIHACGHTMMAGLLPTVIMLAHDMAIDAGFRIATQVGQAFTIINGVRTCPSEHAQNDGQQPTHGGSDAHP